MLTFFSEFFFRKGLDCFAPLPLGDCRILKPYLLEREQITDGTAMLLAVPYATPACDAPDRNLSAYAVAKNYHLFFDSLFAELLPALRERFPEHRFAGFADHSPIAEAEAASRAGLGVIGQNHLLLTEKYSSYVFLGEIITDAHLPCRVGDVRMCEGCGACTRHCPAATAGGCLSALTQKKGTLTDREAQALLRAGSVWGCDICQEVCPHTRRARQRGTLFSPVPFFYEEPIAHLTLAALDGMSEEEFLARAYSWRGRAVIRRNLMLAEGNLPERPKGELPC